MFDHVNIDIFIPFLLYKEEFIKRPKDIKDCAELLPSLLTRPLADRRDPIKSF